MVQLPEGLTTPVVVEWYDSEGRLSSGNEVTIRDNIVSQTNVISTLEFNPFRTVHGGQFSCRARVTSPAPPFNISRSAEINIVVGGKLTMLYYKPSSFSLLSNNKRR